MTPYAPPPITLPIPVLYEDEHLIVVDKPTGLLTVPGRTPEKADCLVSRLAKIYGLVRIVHRLDMETSGCVILARTEHTQRDLSLLFEKRTIEKTYVAQVFGTVEGETGSIDLPLMKDWPNRPLQKVDPAGKPSKTLWTCMNRKGETSRLELKPLTGRSHQLRVHLNAIGHPILGDLLYGTSTSRGAADRLQLHATDLAFTHPDTQENLRIHSPPPF